MRTLARRDGDDLATEIDGARLLTWRASWMAKLYTIFEGTSEIQRIVISNALGAAEGQTAHSTGLGGSLNRMFGRGTLIRTQVANAALNATASPVR